MHVRGNNILINIMFFLHVYIFLSKVAASIAGITEKLEKKVKQDRVGHLLESRPDLSDLSDAGIHKGDMAPAIQGLAAKLERQVRNHPRISYSTPPPCIVCVKNAPVGNKLYILMLGYTRHSSLLLCLLGLLLPSRCIRIR